MQSSPAAANTSNVLFFFFFGCCKLPIFQKILSDFFFSASFRERKKKVEDRGGKK